MMLPAARRRLRRCRFCLPPRLPQMKLPRQRHGIFRRRRFDTMLRAPYGAFDATRGRLCHRHAAQGVYVTPPAVSDECYAGADAVMHTTLHRQYEMKLDQQSNRSVHRHVRLPAIFATFMFSPACRRHATPF